MRVMLHKHVNSFWSKVEFPEQWKESTTLPVHKNAENLSVLTIVVCHHYQLHT
jgi:hypothetical protein